MPAKRYNHAYEVAFSVETSHEDGYTVSIHTLIAGMLKRAAELLELTPDEAAEAFHCYDTYEVDQ